MGTENSAGLRGRMDDFAEKLARRRLYSHVRHDEAGMTLADYLVRYRRFDAAGWRAAVLAGSVQVNGRTALPETRLAEHDCVAFFPARSPNRRRISIPARCTRTRV